MSAAVDERVYTTLDKSGWGTGPWQSEPDKVQFVDPATGYPCLAVRANPYLGNWCGYVGVPEGHPAFGRDYDHVDADVHGGLTFASGCLKGPEESSICHVPEPGQPDNVWWLGFDCGHGFDLMPAMAAREAEMGWRPDSLVFQEGQDSVTIEFPRVTYKTLDYVRAECAKLAAQLKEME